MDNQWKEHSDPEGSQIKEPPQTILDPLHAYIWWEKYEQHNFKRRFTNCK